MKLNDAILSIVACASRSIVALADGTVAIFSRHADGQWDFGQYWLLTLGDPKCSGKLYNDTNSFLKCLQWLIYCVRIWYTHHTAPAKWNNAVITILFKKGDIKKLENYRPISLLSHLYKLFTKVIVNRIKNKLDAYQPREQAGFRSGYSTSDHLQAIKTLIENTSIATLLHVAIEVSRP